MIPPKKQYSIAKGERQGENWSSIVMASGLQLFLIFLL
jgi:hypothetical protein